MGSLMSRATALKMLQKATPRIAPTNSLAHLKLRLRVLARAVRYRADLRQLAAEDSPGLHMIGQERPQTLIGPLVWPYLCAGWSAPQRLARLRAHYRIVDGLGAPFPFSSRSKLILADLDDLHPGLRVVLDQPQWFMREGGLTLNLFVGDFRAYSLAFSLGRGAQGIDCMIGSVQGRNSDEATAIYRDLTKAAHGLRPRDLLIELLRILCRHWQVSRLLAVRDSERHHRHAFFGGKTVAPQNYDAIWQDRGGHLADDHFYELPIASERRADEDIKPNKRSLYRRRYRFLDQMETDIPAGLAAARPVEFRDL